MPTKDSELVTTSLLKKKFPKNILETHCHRGDETVVVDRKDLLSICEFLRDDEGCSYEMLVDLTAVDLLEQNRTPVLKWSIILNRFVMEKNPSQSETG